MNRVEKISELYAKAESKKFHEGRCSDRNYGLLVFDDKDSGNVVFGRNNLKLIIALHEACPLLKELYEASKQFRDYVEGDIWGDSFSRLDNAVNAFEDRKELEG